MDEGGDPWTNTGCELGRKRGRNERSSGDGIGDEDGNGNGNEDKIVEVGREVKKLKKPHKSCRRRVRSGETWVERRNHVEKKGLVQ